ncbi:hypothetical protein FIU97_05925 [Roseivivax sp. THAF40]|nr:MULTISPECIES: DUF4177 domain-containing protein [unclassified Roseivivax]QFS82318.1 hypothetical protein FIV09_05715 [Roseivivax sp. THAF197b]QFT46109.1 hypothetical protein FIU97_05925 [Roseivivax sp. THAF40]
MPHYEYRVLPAPEKGLKAKGVKGPKARFAHSVETLMNEMGAEGWEYLRADTLPSEERAGLTSSVTEWRTLLVFRRIRLDHADAFRPKELPAPDEDDAQAATPADANQQEQEPSAKADAEDKDADRMETMLKSRADSLVAMPTDLGGPESDGGTADRDDPSPDDAPRRD